MEFVEKIVARATRYDQLRAKVCKIPLRGHVLILRLACNLELNPVLDLHFEHLYVQYY